MSQGNAVAVMQTSAVPEGDKALVRQIEYVLSDFRSQLGGGNVGDFEIALVQARAVRMMRELLTDKVMNDLMQLMNTQTGFMTDRNPAQTDRNGNRHKPYDRETVKDCVVVALLSGAKLIRNQFNIIAGKCYLTKEFTHHAILRFPGLTDLSYQIGDIIKYGDKAAKVEAVASYKVRGVPYEIICRKSEVMDLRLVVNCYSNSSPDEIRGRAEAKLFRQILSRLTGLNLDPDDPFGGDQPEVPQANAGNTPSARVVLEPRVIAGSFEPAGQPATNQAAVERNCEVPAKAEPKPEVPAKRPLSDATAANHILEAFIADLQGLSLVSEVQKLLADREKVVDSSKWSDELKEQTIMSMVERATETMDFIRNRRGEGSN